MINQKPLLQALYSWNKTLLGLAFFLLFSTVYFVISVFVLAPTPNTVAYSDNNFYVLNLNIPGNLNFCGEKIPSNDYDIKEALDKEFFGNSYWKSNSVALFNKTQRWFPYIEPILKREGVPDDFKYLAFIESHLSNATSPAGAAGFWQLVPGSAANYGLIVNGEVDERYHVEKATRAACKHIKDAYVVFKNWTLAAAAYNLGIGGVQHELEKQGTDNYYNLILNPETGSFVYRILAYKTLFSNPAHFGINKKGRGYLPKMALKSFKVDSTISSLSAFAKHIGSNKATIKAFNPWLLKDALHNPEKRTFEIVIPKKPELNYSGYLGDLSPGGYSGLQTVPAETTAVTTATEQVIAVEPVKTDSVPMVKKTTFYVVKNDEPLKNIADQHHVKVEDLKKWNSLETETATKGQVLTIHYYIPKEK